MKRGGEKKDEMCSVNEVTNWVETRSSPAIPPLAPDRNHIILKKSKKKYVNFHSIDCKMLKEVGTLLEQKYQVATINIFMHTLAGIMSSL